MLTISVSNNIIKVFIGDMLLKQKLDKGDDAMEQITQTNALKLFHEQPYESYVYKAGNPVM